MNGEPSRSRVSGRGPLAAAWVLLVVTGFVVALAALQDLATRAASPEGTVRAYFNALEKGDAEGALAQIAPGTRAASTPFVENNLRNQYTITGIAVQYPSVLTWLTGRAGGPGSVTVFLDITQAVGGEHWQAAPQVPLVEADGGWYLARAPLDVGP